MTTFSLADETLLNSPVTKPKETEPAAMSFSLGDDNLIQEVDPPSLGGSPDDLQRYMSENNPAPKNLRETFFGEVAKMKEGATAIYLRSRLQGIRSHIDTAKKIGTPKTLAAVKDLEQDEMDVLENMLQAQDLYKTYVDYQAKMTPQNEGFGDKVVRSVVASSPGVLAGIGAYAFGGPTAAGLVGPAVSGTQVFVDSYNKASKTLPHDAAISFALTDTAVEFYGDKLMVGAATKAAKPILDRFIGSILMGATEEGVAQAAQSFHEYVELNPKMTLKQAMTDFATAVAAGGLMGGGMTGGTSAVDSATRAYTQATRERELETLKQSLFDQAFQEMESRFKPAEQVAIELLDPGLTRRTSIDLSQVNQAGRTVVPGDTPVMTEPTPIQDVTTGTPLARPNTPMFSMEETFTRNYGGARYVYNEDLDKAFAEDVATRPLEAAQWTVDNLSLFLANDRPSPANLVQTLVEQGVVTPENQKIYTDELARILQDGAIARENKDLQEIEKEIEEISKRLAASTPSPWQIPLYQRESQELTFLTDRAVSELSLAQTPDQLYDYLVKHSRGLQGSVTGYAFNQLLSMAKSFPDSARRIAQTFIQTRTSELQSLDASGTPPQVGRSVGELFDRTWDPRITSASRPRFPNEGAFAVAFDDLVDPQKGLTGQTLIHPDLPGWSDRLTELGERWLKMAGLSEVNVVIVPNDDPNAGGSAIYYKTVDGRTVALIRLSKRPQKEMLTVFTHEMGHIIGPLLYFQSPDDVKTAVLADYSATIRSWANMTGTEALTRLMGPDRSDIASQYGKDFNEYAAQALIESVMQGAPIYQYNSRSNQMVNYFASFEEYFSFGMERLLAKDLAGVQTPVRSLFAKAFAALKSIWSSYKATSRTDETFAHFLEYHFKQAEARGIKERTSVLLAQYNDLLYPGFRPQVPGHSLKKARELNSQMLTKILPEQPMDQLEAEAAQPVASPGNPRIRRFLNKRLGVDEDLSGLDGDLDNFTWLKRLFGNLILLAKANPHIKELSDPSGPINAVTGQRQFGYLDLAQFYAQERMKWIVRADERAKDWNTLGEQDKKELAAALYEETLGTTFFTDQDLTLRGLTPDAMRVFKEVRADFRLFLDDMEASAIAKATARLNGNLALPARLAEIRDNFNKLRSKPYFPLSRFGKNLVVVRVPQGAQPGPQGNPGELLWFESFDTSIEAKLSIRKLKGQFPGMDIKQDETNEMERSMMGIPPQIWETIRQDLQLDPAQEQRLNDLIYKLAPEQRFIKRLMKRKNTPGFGQDALRSYAHYFMHGSGHMARTKWGDQMSDALARLRQSANEVQGDATIRRRIANYVSRHLDYTFNPGNEWAGLRAVVAVAYLWGMLRTALTNLTQVPMFTYPHLAAKYGDGAAMAALGRAYKNVPKTITATRKLTTWENDALTKDSQGLPLTPKEKGFVDRFYGLSTEQRAAIERGVREGFLDESFAMVLAGLANGNLLSRIKATSNVGYYARTLAWAGMIPFEAAEKLNRRVTFTAAFELELKARLDAGVSQATAEEEAFQAAKTAVQTTQFEYAKWNRPEVLRGKPGSFLLFMQYQFNALSFMMGGDKGWWRAWAMMFLFGGLFGLPFMEDIERFISWLLSSKNKRVDVKHEVKQFTKEVLGDKSSLLDHGISSYGFGLPFLGDMSASVSLGRVIPGMHMLGQTQDFNTSVARGLNDFGGATTSMILSMARGLSDPSLPMWRRMELMNPVAVGDRMLQSARWFSKGEETSMSGRNITTFDTDNWKHLVEIGANVGGFTPRSVTVGEEGRGPGRETFYLRQEMAQFYMARQRALRKAYVDAHLGGDFKEKKAARDEIKRYNEEVPTPALKITGSSLGQAVRNRARNEIKDERMGATNRLERGVNKALEE